MQYSGLIEAQSKNKIDNQTPSTDIKLKAFWSTEKDASKGRKKFENLLAQHKFVNLTKMYHSGLIKSSSNP